MDKKSKYKLDELQEIARQHTFEALSDYEIPDEVRQKLILGTSFEGNNRIFELYIPGEKPADAKVISKAVINIFDANCRVEIFGLKQKSIK